MTVELIDWCAALLDERFDVYDYDNSFFFNTMCT